MTRSTSEFGGALDSLADVVTFGVAPALLAKQLMQGTLGLTHPRLAFLTASFYAGCAALRCIRPRRSASTITCGWCSDGTRIASASLSFQAALHARATASERGD